MLKELKWLRELRRFSIFSLFKRLRSKVQVERAKEVEVVEKVAAKAGVLSQMFNV